LGLYNRVLLFGSKHEGIFGLALSFDFIQKKKFYNLSKKLLQFGEK